MRYCSAHAHTHTRTHTLTFSLYLFHLSQTNTQNRHTHIYSLSHTHKHSHTYINTYALKQPLSNTFSLSLSSFTHTCTKENNNSSQCLLKSLSYMGDKKLSSRLLCYFIRSSCLPCRTISPTLNAKIYV